MDIKPTGPAPAKIMLVGEFPNERDAAAGEIFVGFAGDELSRMLSEAGIFRNQCFVTSVVRVRPYGNSIESLIATKKTDRTEHHMLLRDKWCVPAVREGAEMLAREIELVRPTVIIALGNLALWALTGNWGITSWRGSTLPCDLPLALDYKPIVLPTYSPSAILFQWSWRPIAVHDFRRAAAVAKNGGVKRPDYKFLIRPGYGQVIAVLDKLQRAVEMRPLKLSVDKETRAGHIACIGLAWSKLEALCIPFMCVERQSGYWDEDQEAEIVWRLHNLLTHKNCQVIGQNFLYDAQYSYRHWHFVPNLVRDTMLAQHVCFSNLPKGLDFLSSMYCEFHEYWKDEGKDWDENTGEDQLWEYNCKDGVITYEVDEVEAQNVAAMGLQVQHDFQQKLFWPVLKTMNRGIRVDKERRSTFAMELFDAIAERQQWLIDVLGFQVNIKSPAQMQQLFYEVLNQKPVLARKTKRPTCNDEALVTIAEREPLLRPIIKKIQELRSLSVFLSTFVAAPLDIDGRIRCSFNIGGTETYRFSSSKNAFGTGLNLQNIPAGGNKGDPNALELPNVRTLFIPDEGMTFFDIDLSSADLRIVVWESDETEMKAMLREGLDPYTEIAKEFYHDPSITKKDPRRQTFKAFAHGTNYLGSAKGLAERLGLSVQEAEKTQRWYFSKFPRIKRWQDDLKDQVYKRGMIQNILGYRTYFFDRIEGTIFNQAAAWIPQSTVACIINRAYMEIYETMPEVEILLQVHDSLAGQFPTKDAERILPQIIKKSEIVLPYSDPLVIPVGIKSSTKSWGDCK